MLLVLGDFPYFGTSIKTGNRIICPVPFTPKMIEELGIRNVRLPIFTPGKKTTITAQSTIQSFNCQHRERLISMNCPVTQVYAFRHLYNQMGEMYGVPQEIRARSMGHSTATNDSVYKKRSNLRTSIDILTKHNKQPLTYEVAVEELKRLQFDVNSPELAAILRVIYRLGE
jgi:hypothetical protein